jgi:hypothetical protein
VIAVWIAVAWVALAFGAILLWVAYLEIGRALVSRRISQTGVADDGWEDWISQMNIGPDPLANNPAYWPDFLPDLEHSVN